MENPLLFARVTTMDLNGNSECLHAVHERARKFRAMHENSERALKFDLSLVGTASSNFQAAKHQKQFQIYEQF